MFHKVRDGLDFADIDPEKVVGVDFMSGYGFQQVHNWLLSNGVIEGSGGGGAACGV
jgi:hypothetical protein